MKTKKIKVPIYPADIYVHLFDIDKIGEEYEVEIHPSTRAVVFNTLAPNGGLRVHVAFKEVPRLGVLAHECVHATNSILEHSGVVADHINDETQAYLLQWIIVEIEKFLLKYRDGN